MAAATLRFAKVLCTALAVVSAQLTGPLPDTFTFVDNDYTGHRFEGLRIAVFGGTSGIGFAAAALFTQECAKEVVVISRNELKGDLAIQILSDISQQHCQGRGVRPRFVRADVKNRTQVRQALRSFQLENGSNGELHAVLNSCGISGYVGMMADMPDDALFGEHDPIQNNLYGALMVTQESLRYWGLRTGSTSSLAYMPSLVHLSSEQGMAPCPGCGLYAASKHGIVGIVTSVAAAYDRQVRVNAVLPGLVDTPLSWNQARGFEMLSNGTLVPSVHQMQTSWQCVVDGVVINGDCEGGGNGYGCPCEDIRRDDPRIKALFGSIGIADPRKIAAAILRLSESGSNKSGRTVVVDHQENSRECTESLSSQLSQWAHCPIFNAGKEADAIHQSIVHPRPTIMF